MNPEIKFVILSSFMLILSGIFMIYVAKEIGFEFWWLLIFPVLFVFLGSIYGGWKFGLRCKNKLK